LYSAGYTLHTQVVITHLYSDHVTMKMLG